MNTLIIYTSKHGTTKQYATWLQAKIFDAISVSIEDADGATLDKSDCIVMMAPIYMGQLKHIGPLLDLYAGHFLTKKLIVCSVGILPIEGDLESVLTNVVDESLLRSISYYKLPGKVKFLGLSRYERFMFRGVMQMHSDQGALDEDTLMRVVAEIKAPVL